MQATQNSRLALVTGGSGFIGSEVIRQLTAQGVRVRALLRKTSPRENLQGLEFETCIGDLADTAALREAVKGVDYVFHLAGVVAAKNRDEYFKHNATGTANLAQACAEENSSLKRFVYVSSLAASGPASTLNAKTEEDTEAPISAYGESKLGGEKELLRWAQKYSTTIVRPPAVYGPKDRGIFEFIKTINSGVMPVFPGKNDTKEKYYSSIYVEDLVSGIVQCGLAADQNKHEVFFITGDGFHTWTQMMTAMANALGKKPIKLKLPSFAWTGLAAVYTALSAISGKSFPLTLDKLNELRPDFWICSNEYAKKKIGFQPQYGLQEGLNKTVVWYRENHWL